DVLLLLGPRRHLLLDGLALRVPDLRELLLDVVQHRAEIVLLEALLALLLELLQEVLEPRHAPALWIAGTALEEPAQGAHQIALGEEVIGHGRQELVGVEIGDGLGAVPAGISAQSRHGLELTYATTHDHTSEPPYRRPAVHPRPDWLGRFRPARPARGRRGLRVRGRSPRPLVLPVRRHGRSHGRCHEGRRRRGLLLWRG